MMEYEFEYDGKTHRVEIEAVKSPDRESDGFKALIGEREYRFDAITVTPGCFSIVFDGLNIPVYVAESETAVFVHLSGRVFRLDKAIDDRDSVTREGLEFGAKDEISTPMPGKVVKILVKEGDKVKVKQPLVIVESMKMENEIKSPTDGEVKSIHFADGDLVEPGQPIVKLTPSE
jgi:biotin carboxyl carrier protein